MVLYFIYLGLFTYLSFDSFEVYDPMGHDEIIFWVFNMGYVLFEIQSISSEGPASYYSQRENYFDTFISILFTMSISIRLWGATHHKICADLNDCSDDVIHTIFVILWAAATIALWLRIVIFCVFSRNLGPMIQMIFRMMDDIMTFMYVLIILFAGFTFALSFLMGDIHEDFATPDQAALTLFMAALGEFDFDGFDEAMGTPSPLSDGMATTGSKAEDILIIAAHVFIIVYLVVASLVLLNILIAMMAVK